MAKYRLSRRRLQAIQEALHARLGGAIEDVDNLKIDDYRHALGWAYEELDRRAEKKEE